MDENYTKLLFSRVDLDLNTVFLLDKIQKRIPITKDEATLLKRRGFIEGRYPNVYVAAEIAEQVDRKQDYIKNRAFDDEYYKQLILEYLKSYKEAKFSEIFKLLEDKVSDVLNRDQKKRKVKYLLNQLKESGQIDLDGKTRGAVWKFIDKNK